MIRRSAATAAGVASPLMALSHPAIGVALLTVVGVLLLSLILGLIYPAVWSRNKQRRGAARKVLGLLIGSSNLPKSP